MSNCFTSYQVRFSNVCYVRSSLLTVTLSRLDPSMCLGQFLTLFQAVLSGLCGSYVVRVRGAWYLLYYIGRARRSEMCEAALICDLSICVPYTGGYRDRSEFKNRTEQNRTLYCVCAVWCDGIIPAALVSLSAPLSTHNRQHSRPAAELGGCATTVQLYNCSVARLQS